MLSFFIFVNKNFAMAFFYFYKKFGKILVIGAATALVKIHALSRILIFAVKKEIFLYPMGGCFLTKNKKLIAAIMFHTFQRIFLSNVKHYYIDMVVKQVFNKRIIGLLIFLYKDVTFIFLELQKIIQLVILIFKNFIPKIVLQNFHLLTKLQKKGLDNYFINYQKAKQMTFFLKNLSLGAKAFKLISLNLSLFLRNFYYKFVKIIGQTFQIEKFNCKNMMGTTISESRFLDKKLFYLLLKNEKISNKKFLYLRDIYKIARKFHIPVPKKVFPLFRKQKVIVKILSEFLFFETFANKNSNEILDDNFSVLLTHIKMASIFLVKLLGMLFFLVKASRQGVFMLSNKIIFKGFKAFFDEIEIFFLILWKAIQALESQ